MTRGTPQAASSIAFVDPAWSVSRMPARPHRTVDRVIGILETVSLSPRGVTLAELAAALDAAKSSVQELTNGLLARGYLIEEERPIPPRAGAVHPRLAGEQAGRAVPRPSVRGRAGQGSRLHRPGRGARRGRHRLHRLRGRRVARADIRRAQPRPSSAVHERGREDPARLRPRRRDAPPSSTSPVRSRRARSGSSWPSSPRSAPADSPSTGGPRSPTRSSSPRLSWPRTAD